MRIDGEMVSLGRDPQKALAYFNAAVAMGHVEAMFQAALLYADGQETLTIARCTVSACVCVCVCVLCVYVFIRRRFRSYCILSHPPLFAHDSLSCLSRFSTYESVPPCSCARTATCCCCCLLLDLVISSPI